MSDQALIGTAALAARLGCTTETVRRNCREGLWPHSKLDPRPGMEKSRYRFTPQQVQAIIEWLTSSGDGRRAQAA